MEDIRNQFNGLKFSKSEITQKTEAIYNAILVNSNSINNGKTNLLENE